MKIVRLLLIPLLLISLSLLDWISTRNLLPELSLLQFCALLLGATIIQVALLRSWLKSEGDAVLPGLRFSLTKKIPVGADRFAGIGIIFGLSLLLILIPGFLTDIVAWLLALILPIYKLVPSVTNTADNSID